jgi:hypothetical protein
MVSVGSNLYSVPDATWKRVVEVHTLANEVRISEDGALIAAHPVLEGPPSVPGCSRGIGNSRGSAPDPGRDTPDVDPANRRYRRRPPARLLAGREPATIAKAVCKPIHLIDCPIGRAQKQRSSIQTPPIRQRTRLPQRGLPPLQNQAVLGYTLSASGLPESSQKSLRHNNFRYFAEIAG